MYDVTTPAEPASILVVDDRPENLTALEAVLEPLGCPIVTATSGSAALKLMLERQFAVILLDVFMPDMDGFEVASYIRSRHRTSATPIIFLSAVSTSAEHVFRGYETGAVDYIIKPFDPVAIWRSLDDEGHVHLVERYLRQAGFARIERHRLAEWVEDVSDPMVAMVGWRWPRSKAMKRN